MEIREQLLISGFSFLASFSLLTGTLWSARSPHQDTNSIPIRPECFIEFSSFRSPPEWPSIKIEVSFLEVWIFVLETNLLTWQIQYVRRNYPNIKLHVCRDKRTSKGKHLPLCRWSTDYFGEYCIEFGESVQYVYRLCRRKLIPHRVFPIYPTTNHLQPWQKKHKCFKIFFAQCSYFINSTLKCIIWLGWSQYCFERWNFKEICVGQPFIDDCHFSASESRTKTA